MHSTETWTKSNTLYLKTLKHKDMEKKIIEGNQLIAEFMGLQSKDGWFRASDLSKVFPFTPGIDGNGAHHLKCHSSWDWLMPVIEKIEKTEIHGMGFVDFHIMPDAVIVTKQEDEDNPMILINLCDGIGSVQKEVVLYVSKLNAAYNAVIEFITWYNLKM